MAIIDSFSPDVNFWERHPQLLVKEEFKTFHSGDTSPDKAMSSKVMWAIGLIYDYESEYALQNVEQRTSVIEADFLESEGFFEVNKERLEPLIAAYMWVQQDAPRRALSEWDDGMDKRAEFLRTTEYSIENGTKIDKIRTETEKLFKTRDKLKDMYLTKKALSNAEGDYIPSLIEQGKL